MLVALLAILAPAFDAPLAGNRLGEHVSAPADPQGDAAPLVAVALSLVEDIDEETDQDDAIFISLASLPCAADGDYRAIDAWIPAVPRPAAHSCTGPPNL